MNLSRKSKIILFALAILVIIAGLTYAVIRLYPLGKKVISRQLPALSSLAERIILPEPLTGPERLKSADHLNSDKIIELTNTERDKENLSTLVQSDNLSKAAEKKIEDMFEEQYFAHISPVTGQDVTYFVGLYNYGYVLVGENLAMGDFADEEELVQSWMDSPGHRENILKSEFTEIGVAAQLGEIEGRTTWLAVQIFAKPSPNCYPPSADFKTEIESKKAEYEQINQLNSQIENLYSESQALLTQGNEKIRQGNQIYQETGDKSQAQPYWDEGQKLQNDSQLKRDQAQELQEKVDNLTGLYEQIKSLIEQYNQQVKSYNDCLGV